MYDLEGSGKTYHWDINVAYYTTAVTLLSRAGKRKEARDSRKTTSKPRWMHKSRPR